MRKTNKKGFTIVELVIVIAVIAILAAVLIPTYSSLVKKANRSADIQAVREMNVALAIYTAEAKPDDLSAALNALSAQNITADNCHPITSGTQFYWVKSENRIVYAELEDGKKTVLYPEECKDWTYKAGDWFVLDASIEKVSINYEKAVNDGALSISSAGELAQFAADFSNESNTEARTVTKITLTADIYLDGAAIHISNDKNNLEFDGNGHTIYGLKAAEYNKMVDGVPNEWGFIASVGRNKKVTIKNVTFDGASVGSSSQTSGSKFALIAGNVSGELVVENVTIKNSSIGGFQNVGAVVGMASSGSTVTLNNVKFDNVSVTGLYNTAKIIGRTLPPVMENSVEKYAAAKVSYENTTGDGITVKLNEVAYEAEKKGTPTWTEFTVDSVSAVKTGPYVAYTGTNGEAYYINTITDKLAWAYCDQCGTYTYGEKTITIKYKPTDDSINISTD